jgi:long-chain acyl-CoA synthetase
MNPKERGLIFPKRFELVSTQFPDRIAFRLKAPPEGYRDILYRDARRQSHGVARGLIGLGLARGARVAVLSENRPEWVVAYFGAMFAGMTVVPLDTQISPPEWRRLLDDSGTEVVFVSGHLLQALRSALEGSPLLDGVVCLDPGGAPRDLPGFVEWGSNLSPAPVLPDLQPSDVAVIIYTSGTTGKPKGVMLTQGNIAAELDSIFDVAYLDENDVALGLLPLQHVLSSIVSVLTPLSLGGNIAFVDSLKRAEILEALEQAGITLVPTVPQFFYLFHKRIEEELKRKPAVARKLFRLMLRVNRFSQKRLGVNLGKKLFSRVHRTFGSRMRIFVCGGSAFDPKVAQDFYDLGFTILQGYGLTETTGACTVTRIEDNVIGSVGTPLLGASIRIDEPDDTGVGEILIRGPQVMAGYYNRPDATAEVTRDGWFCSGDLGRLDKYGNLFITGRKKEVIVLPNGKNIYPDEIEAHYLQCPFIQEIAVLGIREQAKHATDERLHAVVVPNFDYLKSKRIANTREILRDEIGRWSNRLPSYKRLNSYQIQKDPLPRTTTRKIKRLELKRLIEAGELGGLEGAGAGDAAAAADRAVFEGPVGREVLRCLKEDYGREQAATPDMNIELDLGFDSMERVELLASLEQSLNLTLPEGFGADLFTLSDLIHAMEQESVAASGSSGSARQNWTTILSEESLAHDPDLHLAFSGATWSFLKYLVMRCVYLFSKVFLRLRVEGRENLPARGAHLICPNHLSYIDAFIVMSALPWRTFRRVFFVGASEYFESRSMKIFAALTNITPVDPDANLLRAMKVGGVGLRRGQVLCIFPEGARSFDGELKEFKKGAAILSAEIGVPIIPVGLKGTYEVWARDSGRIRLHPVRVRFEKPMQAAMGDPRTPYQESTNQLRSTIEATVKSL